MFTFDCVSHKFPQWFQFQVSSFKHSTAKTPSRKGAKEGLKADRVFDVGQFKTKSSKRAIDMPNLPLRLGRLGVLALKCLKPETRNLKLET